MTDSTLKQFVIENETFALYLRSDCVAEHLIHKATGIECLMEGEETALFSLTEQRPFNNEIKLAHPNKRMTFQANRVRMEENRLIVGFELVTFEAIVEVKIAPQYIAFKFVDFIVRPEDFGTLAMTPPPVCEFRMVQLPIKDRENFGEWLNVTWDDTIAVNLLGTSPYARIDAERRKGYHIMSADSLRETKLKDVSAALVVSSYDALFDAIEAVEIDYNLPRGVESRRSGTINHSAYWCADVNPLNVDEHIAYAKQGGFTQMLLYYPCMSKEPSYDYLGDYDLRKEYPNGLCDLEAMLAKIKAAGITPGFHFLHTHIGMKSRYVAGGADHRLNLTRHFTLAKAIGEDDTTIYVEQNPLGAVMDPRCRILQFGHELIGYESYTTEPPYCFIGCERGYKNTPASAHELGLIGGLLDVSEFGARTVYLDQYSSLQDEIGDKLAAIYNAGFEFVYLDGSEGVNPPFEIHVPNAQYRVYRKFHNAPLYCAGAAKSHFSWHMMGGGNAFDIFPNDIFKTCIARFPAEEAPRMAKDFTVVNFGWWAYREDTQPDLYEYGTSRAAAWDCPATMMAELPTMRKNPRTDDILEVMRRWDDVRHNGFLTEERKKMLQNTAQEHILLINEEKEYELVAYDCISDAAGGDKAVAAFAFTRKNENYVVCWHTSGSGTLTLPLDVSSVVYEDELGAGALTLVSDGANAVLPLDKRRYLRTSLTMDELIAAFRNAKLND